MQTIRSGLGVPGGRVLLLRAVLVSALLAGCGEPDLDERLGRYRAAVEAALRTEAGSAPASPSDPATPVRLPARRHRAIEVAPHRIGILHFLALQDCRLGVLAGERTSPLGRQLEESRRLVHELDVLSSAGGCLDADDDPERRAALRAIVLAKRRELPLHLWNAVWAGPEMEASLEPAPAPVDATPHTGRGASALEDLATRLVAPLRTPDDGARVEQALDRLRRSVALGPLLVELDALRVHLEYVATRLEAVEGTGHCTPVAARLARVFREKWLAFVQTAASDRHARVREALVPLDAVFRRTRDGLYEAGFTPSDAMATWHATVVDPASPGGLWRRYEAAREAHVAAWRPILVACGVLPADP